MMTIMEDHTEDQTPQPDALGVRRWPDGSTVTEEQNPLAYVVRLPDAGVASARATLGQAVESLRSRDAGPAGPRRPSLTGLDGWVGMLREFDVWLTPSGSALLRCSHSGKVWTMEPEKACLVPGLPELLKDKGPRNGRPDLLGAGDALWLGRHGEWDLWASLDGRLTYVKTAGACCATAVTRQLDFVSPQYRDATAEARRRLRGRRAAEARRRLRGRRAPEDGPRYGTPEHADWLGRWGAWDLWALMDRLVTHVAAPDRSSCTSSLGTKLDQVSEEYREATREARRRIAMTDGEAHGPRHQGGVPGEEFVGRLGDLDVWADKAKLTVRTVTERGSTLYLTQCVTTGSTELTRELTRLLEENRGTADPTEETTVTNEKEVTPSVTTHRPIYADPEAGAFLMGAAAAGSRPARRLIDDEVRRMDPDKPLWRRRGERFTLEPAVKAAKRVAVAAAVTVLGAAALALGTVGGAFMLRVTHLLGR